MERFQNLGVFLWIATCVLNLLGLFITRIFGVVGAVNCWLIIWDWCGYKNIIPKDLLKTVQDLIFVPYHLQKPDEWDRRKQLSSFYLSYQCGISRSFWKPINVRNIGIAHQIDVVFYKRLWPHLFIIALSLDLHLDLLTPVWIF